MERALKARKDNEAIRNRIITQSSAAKAKKGGGKLVDDEEVGVKRERPVVTTRAVVKQEKKPPVSANSKKDICIHFLAESFKLVTTSGNAYVCPHGKSNCRFEHVNPRHLTRKMALKNLEKVRDEDLKFAVQEAADSFQYFKP